MSSDSSLVTVTPLCCQTTDGGGTIWIAEPRIYRDRRSSGLSDDWPPSAAVSVSGLDEGDPCAAGHPSLVGFHTVGFHTVGFHTVGFHSVDGALG